MYTVLLVIHTILVLFLIVMVLIQRSDSDGLSGLGGGGGNQFLTGRGAANLLTRTTAILAGAFMLTSLVLAFMAGQMKQSGSILDVPVEEQTQPAPAQKAPAETKKAPAAKKQDAPAAPAVPKPE
jgi:preprotein translocase subunit SecG